MCSTEGCTKYVCPRTKHIHTTIQRKSKRELCWAREVRWNKFISKLNVYANRRSKCFHKKHLLEIAYRTFGIFLYVLIHTRARVRSETPIDTRTHTHTCIYRYRQIKRNSILVISFCSQPSIFYCIHFLSFLLYR